MSTKILITIDCDGPLCGDCRHQSAFPMQYDPMTHENHCEEFGQSLIYYDGWNRLNECFMAAAEAERKAEAKGDNAK